MSARKEPRKPREAPPRKRSPDQPLPALVQTLHVSPHPPTPLRQILLSFLASDPPRAVIPNLLAAFHRLTTPITTPLGSLVEQNTQYILAILALVAETHPAALALLSPPQHFARLFAMFLAPLPALQPTASLLEQLSDTSTPSLTVDLHALLARRIRLPTPELALMFLALRALQQMDAVVSLPPLPDTSAENLRLLLPVYADVLLHGSTQPLPVVDDFRRPVALAVGQLPAAPAPFVTLLTALTNSTNAPQLDAALGPAVLTALDVPGERVPEAERFDVFVLQLSVAANALYELPKTGALVARHAFVRRAAAVFAAPADTTEEKVVRGYAAVVLSGAVAKNPRVQSCGVAWADVMQTLEEFAAFQHACGAMDETSQRRLVESMESLERLTSEPGTSPSGSTAAPSLKSTVSQDVLEATQIEVD